MIRWDDRATTTLLNPRLPAPDADAVRRAIAACGPLDAHVWLTTSGTTGRIRPVALGKVALLAAATAVNRHLEAAAGDVWCRPLPLFHVGGLGIHARAHLTGSPVHVLEPWDPLAFHRLLAEAGVTLTSLVPTQVRDLLTHGLRPPVALRAVLVGGGALPRALHDRAREEGWPLRPSYGATETAAAVAVGTAPAPLRVLPHVEARVAADGRLALRGPPLFTGYATADGLDDPKVDGWWTSGDLGTLTGGDLRVTGRADDVVKVGGESVALDALQATLESLLPEDGVRDAAVVAVPDERLGAVVVLAVVGNHEGAERLRARYDAAVLPFERARAVAMREEIPRSPLGKLRRAFS